MALSPPVFLPASAGPCRYCRASLVFAYGTEADPVALDMAHPTRDAALLCDKLRSLHHDRVPTRRARALILGGPTHAA